MLGLTVLEGAMYYGKPRRRLVVIFDETLRAKTQTAARRLHELVDNGKTPQVQYDKKCDSCSLLSLCMPKVTGSWRTVRAYLANALAGG